MACITMRGGLYGACSSFNESLGLGSAGGSSYRQVGGSGTESRAVELEPEPKREPAPPPSVGDIAAGALPYSYYQPALLGGS